MINKSFVFFLTFISLQAMAKSPVNKPPQKKAPVDVILLDPRIPAGEMDSKTFRTNHNEPPTLLSPEALEEVFAKSGLTSYMGAWDQMDKDLYVITARSVSLPELQKQYPAIPLKVHQRFIDLFRD